MIRASNRLPPYQTKFSNGSYDAVADLPTDKGGAGCGFGPHELLEAALATCLTMSVRLYAVKRGLPLQDAKCEVKIDRSQPGFATLFYTLSFDGPLSEEQTAELSESARNCPVARTLTGDMAVQPSSQR